MMRCPFCGTLMVRRKVDVDKTWKGFTITFRGIEADICPKCGEEAYAADDVEMMEELRQPKLAGNGDFPVKQQ